MQSATNKN